MLFPSVEAGGGGAWRFQITSQFEVLAPQHVPNARGSGLWIPGLNLHDPILF